jgi:DNA-binding beta-propeller fold protein YncE
MLFAGLFVTTALLVSSAHAGSTADLQVIKRYALGGKGAWDFLTLDVAARRLYITRDHHVMVMDADSGTLVGDIPSLKRAHGVALVPDLHQGFVSDGHGNSVTVFDLLTLKRVGEIPLPGKNPDAIMFDAASKRVLVFNGHSNNVIAIDPVKGKVVASMHSPGRPEFAVSDGAGHMFFNLEDMGSVARADTNKMKVLNTWKLDSCEGPTGLAIDTARHRLFSVCVNKQMVVVDANDGHIVTSVPIGEDPDAVAYDPDTATIYSSNRDGTLTVIHQDDADHYSVVANVATPQGSANLALDTKTHHVYLASAQFEAPGPPTSENPHPEPTMKPNSFAIVVVGGR